MQKLKDLYTLDLIKNLSNKIIKNYPDFQQDKFINSVFNEEWKNLELKSRMLHIARCLEKNIDLNFAKQTQILVKIAPNFSGFEYMFLPMFISTYGLDNYQISIKALEVFTEFSSSEFAIRDFLIKRQKQTIKQMLIWAKSANPHHRRLASEGIRPLLPWAQKLPQFVKNPLPILEILEILKNDSSLYVRTSVANNLNDISKNQPDLVLNLAKNWQGKTKETDWIIKKGLRTLLKSGNTKALLLFGFKDPKNIQVIDLNANKTVKLGEKLKFSFELISSKNLGKLRLEYQIDFMKKSGKTKPKVFFISEAEIKKSAKKVSKYFDFKQISTRKYYFGTHKLNILVNGKIMSFLEFELF